MGLVLSLYNGINLVLPYRPFFGLRRAWLRLAGVRVGPGTRIAAGARFYDNYITVGEHVWIGPESSILSCRRGAITIGNRVNIAPGVMVVSGTHQLGDTAVRAGKGAGHDILIGEGSWICARAVILGGARIGPGSVIAAGSVVLAGEYPPNSFLAGVPAITKRQLPPDDVVSCHSGRQRPTESHRLRSAGSAEASLNGTQ